MLMVNYKAWKSSSILVSLVVISIFFAVLMPQSQSSKNIMLYDAVVENNATKAKQMIDRGAEINILLPKGFPLISLAIEYENEQMLDVLMLKSADLVRDYKGYNIIEHTMQKKNKKLIQMISEALEKD